jgi:proteasome lid subunit RPN8/RPN11
MQLTTEQQNLIRQLSASGMVEEACGFVFNDGGIHRCFNAHPDPANAFRIEPESYARWESRGIAAVWHSHARHDGLSPSDQAAVLADGELAWIVYCLRTDRFHIVDPTDRGPLIGRTFSYGILDCYSLVSDFHWQHLGIELPPWPRRDYGEWSQRDFTVFDDEVQKHCRQVGAERLLPGDIVFMGRSQTSHIGVIDHTGGLLHHPVGKRSRSEFYGEFWQAKTRSIWRHRQAQSAWAA